MEIIKNKIYNLFANCKIVKGYSRSVICDLQRNNIYPIPNSLESILQGSGQNTIEMIIREHGDENEETIIEYFEFLIANDIIFFHNNPEYFPPLNDQWDEPFEITNAIFDFDGVSKDYIGLLEKAINKIPIKAIQIRVFDEISIKLLENILSALETSGLNSVEIVMRYSKNILVDDLINLALKYNRVFTITVFNAPKETFFSSKNSAFGQVFYVTENAISEKSCGVVLPDFFTMNTKTFTESLSHNSCLNRKISVDKLGFIRNCPSMSKSYGNISSVSIVDALNSKGFKDNWNLTKDEIHVCKDCEFRYVCTDCRAYVEEPENILSKPLKCGYNPYTSEWSDWSNSPLKQKTIEYYGL